MLALTRGIYLYRSACDMGKSFDALCGLLRSSLGIDPLDGSLFVFVNRRRNMVKLLCWDRDGLALWCKRLAVDVFTLPDCSTGAISLCSWKESCREKWKKEIHEEEAFFTIRQGGFSGIK